MKDIILLSLVLCLFGSTKSFAGYCYGEAGDSFWFGWDIHENPSYLIKCVPNEAGDILLSATVHWWLTSLSSGETVKEGDATLNTSTMKFEIPAPEDKTILPESTKVRIGVHSGWTTGPNYFYKGQNFDYLKWGRAPAGELKVALSSCEKQDLGGGKTKYTYKFKNTGLSWPGPEEGWVEYFGTDLETPELEAPVEDYPGDPFRIFSTQTEGHYKLGFYAESYTVPTQARIKTSEIPISFNVGPGFCPNLDFKVLYKGKEYLFDDCAPFGVNDSCRSSENINDFKGGEFLIGDELDLDASSTAGVPENANYAWTVTRIAGGSATRLTELTGKTAKFTIPNDAPADYEISLRISNTGWDVAMEPVVKKIKARAEIKPDFLENPFYQIDYSVGFGYEKKEKIRAKGCYLTNTATLFKDSVPFILNNPARPMNPVSLDDIFVQRGDYLGENALSLGSAVRTQNILSTKYKVRYVGSADGEKSLDDVEDMARKRKLAMLEVHSVSFNNLPVTKPATDISACAKQDPPIADLARCHAILKHVIVVRGARYEGGQRRIIIHDPANKIRQFLDEDYSGFPVAGQFRNVREFVVLPQNNPPVFRRSIEIMMENPNLGIGSALVNGLPIKPVLDKSRRLVKFSDESYLDDLFVTDPDTGELGGGRFFVIPNATENTVYDIGIQSEGKLTGNVFLQVRDESGELVYKKMLTESFSGPGIKNIQVKSSGAPFYYGHVQVDTVSSRKFGYEADQVNIQGSLQFPAEGGPSYLADGLYLMVGNLGFELPGAALETDGNGFRYTGNLGPSFLKRFFIGADGQFDLSLAGLDISGLLSGKKISIEAHVGNSIMSGNITPDKLKSSGYLYARQDKPRYSAGERASIWVYSAAPVLKDVSFHVEAKVDGLKNVALKIEDGKWRVVTPRLGAGDHTLSLKLFRQDARLARSIEQAVENFRKEIFEIDGKLAVETDPEVRDELNRKKSHLNEEIDRLEVNLIKTRVPFGAELSQNIFYE